MLETGSKCCNQTQILGCPSFEDSPASHCHGCRAAVSTRYPQTITRIQLIACFCGSAEMLCRGHGLLVGGTDCKFDTNAERILRHLETFRSYISNTSINSHGKGLGGPRA